MCDGEDEHLKEDDYVQTQFGTFDSPDVNRRCRPSRRSLCIPKRWQVALLANVGLIFAMSARCEFGAIRAMTDENATRTDLPQVTKMFGLSVGLSCILSVALMLALTTVNPYPAMGVSFVLGGLQGFMYPAMHQIWHYWAPPSERSILVTTAHSGAYLGIALGLTTAQILAAFVHWTAPFIFIGTLGSLWMVVWLYYVRLKPGLDNRISQLEKEYIETATMHVANDTATGLVSSIPHFLMGINTALGGRLAGRLIRWDKLSVTNVRKLMNLIGFGTEGLCLLLMSFVMHNATISMLLLIVSVGMSGFAISGFRVNIQDISGKHAGAIMALSNGIGATGGIICPLITESLISSDGAGWPRVFQLAAGIHLSALLFYVAFASGKLQHWAK